MWNFLHEAFLLLHLFSVEVTPVFIAWMISSFVLLIYCLPSYFKSLLGVGSVVVQQVKPSFGISTFCIRVPSIETHLCFWPCFPTGLPAIVPWRQQMTQVSDAYHPCGRPKWSSQPLASAWPSPCCCRNLGSKSVDRRSLSPPFK